MKPSLGIIRSAAPRGDMESLGLQPANRACPRCERPMFLKHCPCFLRRQGWATCAKCPKCGKMIGLQRRPKGKRKI